MATTRHGRYFIRPFGNDDAQYRAYTRYKDHFANREWDIVVRDASEKPVTFGSPAEAIGWLDAMERERAEAIANREADPHYQLVRRMYDEDANDWERLTLEQLQQIAAWLDAAD